MVFVVFSSDDRDVLDGSKVPRYILDARHDIRQAARKTLGDGLADVQDQQCNGGLVERLPGETRKKRVGGHGARLEASDDRFRVVHGGAGVDAGVGSVVAEHLGG